MWRSRQQNEDLPPQAQVQATPAASGPALPQEKVKDVAPGPARSPNTNPPSPTSNDNQARPHQTEERPIMSKLEREPAWLGGAVGVVPTISREPAMPSVGDATVGAADMRGGGRSWTIGMSEWRDIWMTSQCGRCAGHNINGWGWQGHAQLAAVSQCYRGSGGGAFEDGLRSARRERLILGENARRKVRRRIRANRGLQVRTISTTARDLEDTVSEARDWL
ncbi:hypothetical protein K438DRAFT_1769576 [Mycena galopus ATCC 62051]|nr:hypothetical protein K438DRAFT_1769576 [Mycena galopus ATCC 62051]